MPKPFAPFAKLPLLPVWTLLAPPLGGVMLIAGSGQTHWAWTLVLTLALLGAVMASVHHAEVLAERLGEPYGTLLLAVAVTCIEVALIVSLMLAGGAQATALARDTVFAAVMIILNGIVGSCLLVGGLRFGEQRFQLSGVSASLATLAAISTLTLVLPNYTTTTPGPFYSHAQLGFIAVVSLVLYGTFVLVQSVRHRDYFLHDEVPEQGEGEGDAQAQTYTDTHTTHALPSNLETFTSLGLLLIGLAAVVLLAKLLAPTLGSALQAVGAPAALLGVAIAAVVLLPEGISALRAALVNRVQTSLNLALGSALASIGLTIPVVAVVAIATDLPLALGLDAKSAVLLMLSLFVCSLSLGTGRTTVLQGVVHGVIFAVYLFLTVVP